MKQCNKFNPDLCQLRQWAWAGLKRSWGAYYGRKDFRYQLMMVRIKHYFYVKRAFVWDVAYVDRREFKG